MSLVAGRPLRRRRIPGAIRNQGGESRSRVLWCLLCNGLVEVVGKEWGGVHVHLSVRRHVQKLPWQVGVGNGAIRRWSRRNLRQ